MLPPYPRQPPAYRRDRQRERRDTVILRAGEDLFGLVEKVPIDVVNVYPGVVDEDNHLWVSLARRRSWPHTGSTGLFLVPFSASIGLQFSLERCIAAGTVSIDGTFFSI